MSPRPSQPKSERAITACCNCRQRKVRCKTTPLILFALFTVSIGSGGNPCSDCTRLHKECIYPASQRRRKRKIQDHYHNPPRKTAGGTDNGINFSIGGRNETQGSTQVPQIGPSVAFTSLYASIEAEDTQEVPNSHDASVSIQPRGNLRNAIPQAEDYSSMHPISSRAPLARDSPESTGGSDSGVFLRPTEQEDINHALGEFSWEHHDPWSWTSVCSDAGSKWVCSVTRSQDFIPISKRFVNDINRRSPKEESLLFNSVSPGVDKETVLQYVTGKYAQDVCFHQ